MRAWITRVGMYLFSTYKPLTSVMNLPDLHLDTERKWTMRGFVGRGEADAMHQLEVGVEEQVQTHNRVDAQLHETSHHHRPRLLFSYSADVRLLHISLLSYLRGNEISRHRSTKAYTGRIRRSTSRRTSSTPKSKVLRNTQKHSHTEERRSFTLSHDDALTSRTATC